MFKNLPLCVIKNPAGSYSYVGRIPAALGYEVPASKSAVMGCRAYKNDAGELVEMKFPTFPSEQAAIDNAARHGFTVQQ